MKKLLLTSLLNVFIFGSVFAQFSFNTNTNIGQTYFNVNPANKDTFLVHFNTAKANCTWAYTTAPAYTMTWQKCQTQKGLQVKGYLDATTTSEYKIGTTDCNNWGGNRNPIHVASIDSLKALLIKSPGAASNGSTSDSITRPAACLIDNGSTSDQVFSLYPGKVKRQEYWFQYNFSGKSVIDDIQFEIGTLDAGTTGKTATYSLSVATGSESNVVFTKSDFYVTGSGTQVIKLAQTMGTTPSAFSNQKVYIKINTLGTSNASDVVDGIAHAVDASNVPVAYDPQIFFDNLWVTFGLASWPELGAIANDVFQHNNGSPQYLCNNCTDYSAGTPVTIYGGYDQPVTIGLKSADRVGTLVITEANDSHTHTAGFSFAETGAIKKNDGSGNYTIDVPYTRTINATTGEYTLTVDAPASGSGSVNDDIQVTYLQNVPVGSTRLVRLELNNGLRIFYNVSATATVSYYDVIAANNVINSDNAQIWSTKNNIFVANTNNDVQIFNVTGQKVKVATAKEAESGISVQSGIYVIKTGAIVQKVIVE